MFLIKVYLRIKCFIKKIFIKIMFGKKILYGKNLHFRRMFLVYIEDKGKLTIGKNVFFNNFCSISCMNSICIGDDCLFGEGVKIYDHDHIFGEKVLKNKFKKGEVKIGNGCWICSNVIILRDSYIGNNCVIGAGVVIKGVIPDNSIVTIHGVNKISEIKNEH